MQTQLTPRNIETADPLHRFTGMLLAELQATRRPMRIAFPVPRREAELNDWLTDDDDFAGAMHQPTA